MHEHLFFYAHLEQFNFCIGVLLNLLLLFCIYRHTRCDLGAYKYLQVTFIVTDLVYSSVQIVLQERIITHNSVFCLITVGGGNNQFLLCFYLAFYTMTFVLIDYSFLYRWWAVETPERVRYFSKPWFISLLLMIAAVEFTIWYCNCFFIFTGTAEGREKMHEIIMEKYGVDTRIHSMIMGDYVVRNGTFHLRSMAGYGIYVSVLSICFGFMIFASIRIVASLGKTATTLSGKTRNMQKQLFRVLCWQTIVPFVFLYIPCGSSLTLPLLQFDTFASSESIGSDTIFYFPLIPERIVLPL